MKPFWQMLLTCGMVWLVTGMAVAAWVRYRMQREPVGVPRRRRRRRQQRPIARAEQRVKRPVGELAQVRVPEKSDREWLEQVRTSGTDEQIRLLQSDEPRMRLFAATSLEDCRDERALDALIGALGDSEPEVVATVLKGLAGAESVKATDAFLDHLTRDPSIVFHPSLVRRQFAYRQDDLVDWLASRAKAGDPGVISVMEQYASPRAVAQLIDLLKGEEIPLWDRRREEAAESVARLYLSDLVGVAEREQIETLEGVVWIDSRAYKEVYDQGELVRLREPTNKTIWDFIVVGRAKEKKRPEPEVDVVEVLASLDGGIETGPL